MELTKKSLQDKTAWQNANIKLPNFDIEKVYANTRQSPKWLHFGAGNIFRGYIARLQNTLLDAGVADSGIIASDAFDGEIIQKIYAPHDNLSLFVGLHQNGTFEAQIVASIAEAIFADMTCTEAKMRLAQIACNDALQIVSFTITEKGYALHNFKQELLPVVQNDIQNGTACPTHIMAIVTSLLFERFKAGKKSLALLSLDNCSENGEKLKQAILYIAKAWQKNGFVDADFINYLETKIAYPWSMIDKITPRPDKNIHAKLASKGLCGIDAIETSKHTFIAPFVNAEIPEYLVIEDDFPNGRPVLEKAGVYFTTRKNVELTEKMKVTTCLNPLHTALAIFGCLLGYTSIADEMKDELLKTFVTRMGKEEGLRALKDKGILDPNAFIEEVLSERLPNPFIPDTPQRIATDTSQKIAIRFGETIKSFAQDGILNELKFIPCVIAGWFVYLSGKNDKNVAIAVSPDPMLDFLQEKIAKVRDANGALFTTEPLLQILSNSTIFGTDLCQNGLAPRIIDNFKAILSDGLVATLKSLV